ncbi:MAG TPA: uridine diphosphate-N-acetylglucosamine-binding protein YvcK [Trebonia sp.]|nr:uridine diphosphate-N-acetylglucosamine-binding protein YvcK [Trebonia sp.]
MSLKVVALGGGHGLAASLAALRRVTDDVTAIVTVADDGGSSGRLRREFGVLPPGDLRKALAALCGDDDWGRTWSRVVQHRFGGSGDLGGHSVGNILIAALWDLLGDPVAGLDWVARLLRVTGRVLPMAAVPLDIVAVVEGADPARPHEVTEVRGQASVAVTPGRVRSISLVPVDPPAVPEAVAAVLSADWVVFGPGSWFTSVLPHLLVPSLSAALAATPARRLVALNLVPQPGETEGFSPHRHLEVLADHAPSLSFDVVLADRCAVAGAEDELEKAAGLLRASLVLSDVAAADGARHDPVRLAAAYRQVFGGQGARGVRGDGQSPRAGGHRGAGPRGQ